MAGTDSSTPRDIPVDMITRGDAIQFRNWWSERVQAGLKIETANKDLMHLSQIVGTWIKFTEAGIDNPFAGLRLEGKDGGTTPPFSRWWIVEKLLGEGELDRLNEEARDVFLLMVNTGLRPSEITDAPLSDFVLNHSIPHLRVAANGRQLKVQHAARDIPLLGVSLEAAQRIAARGGVKRYAHKAGSWSALVNKYLANNALKETDKHVAYSLRHYVEDALLSAGVDDRIRADILGHKYKRPNYGIGGGLEGRRGALERIAL
ncbi:MAG: tyrosine-type recombinase/integrase [Pseudomonadota bacterium]